MHLPVLDISHEWNPVRRVFASLTRVHPCTCVFLCVDRVFIHWPASDHLHRFSSWLFMSNTAVNICVQIIVWTCPVFLGKTGSNRVVELHTKSGLTPVPSRPPFHVPTGQHSSWSLPCGLPSGCEVVSHCGSCYPGDCNVHVNYWLVLLLLWWASIHIFHSLKSMIVLLLTQHC